MNAALPLFSLFSLILFLICILIPLTIASADFFTLLPWMSLCDSLSSYWSLPLNFENDPVNYYLQTFLLLPWRPLHWFLLNSFPNINENVFGHGRNYYIIRYLTCFVAIRCFIFCFCFALPYYFDLHVSAGWWFISPV